MKRYHDWFKLQKDYRLFKSAIPQDLELYNKIKHNNWKINFKYSHYSIQELFEKNSEENNFDFAIITDIELSKMKLSKFINLIRDFYENSNYGIYFAMLSYYLVPDSTTKNLPGLYSQNINEVFSQLLDFAKSIENVSTVYDYPLHTRWINGKLDEGANFIFVHPNIKYYLWK